MQELPILQAFRAPVWGIEGLRDSDHCHETCQSVARGFGLRVQGFKHSGGCFPADWQSLGSKKRFGIVKSKHIGASGLGVSCQAPGQSYPQSSARIMTYTMFPHSFLKPFLKSSGMESQHAMLSGSNPALGQDKCQMRVYQSGRPKPLTIRVVGRGGLGWHRKHRAYPTKEPKPCIITQT